MLGEAVLAQELGFRTLKSRGSTDGWCSGKFRCHLRVSTWVADLGQGTLPPTGFVEGSGKLGFVMAHLHGMSHSGSKLLPLFPEHSPNGLYLVPNKLFCP